MADLPLAAFMVPALFLLIFLGIPVSFSLIVVSVGFALMAVGDLAGLQLYRFVGSVASNYALAAVPLFIFMGAMLEGSGMAARLFALMKRWFGRLPGGMSIATIAMCTVFAAGTGIVGAVEVMVGLLAIPAMMREGYDRRIISGVICAGGSLGTMIPPSIVVIIYASAANQSVGDLFAAVLAPGAIMVALFIAWVVIHGLFLHHPKPEDVAEAVPGDGPAELTDASVFSLLPPLILVFMVVGSIMAGIAAVTEAAAVGAVGAVLLNILYRDFNWQRFGQATLKTVMVTSMILLIVVGGTLFTSVFRLTGGAGLVRDLVNASDLSSMQLTLMFLVVVFILGALLDWVSVVLIAVPIFLPFLAPNGIDAVWFAVLVIIMLQTSYLTPPMAPSIFYLRSIAPPSFSYSDMYLGVLPFVVCQLIVLVLVFLFPGLATAIPDYLISVR
ncbi:TRAP dicarboxylate transporter subunit DctM [Stappia sp. 22II-S9-Z10]|nr:TRAP dicarboxylate transporter subunit DctM [Stappia sp. 22II-S9-Z10]